MLSTAEPVIRPMANSDLDGVLAIEQISYPAPWKREHFLQEIFSHSSFPYVAVLDDQIAGFVCLMSLFEEAQILNIAVAPQYRCKGVAGKLLELAVGIARERGAEVLTLEVRESNASAIRLYEGFGFVRYFVRKGYYEGKEDALLMEKPLI
jgi:ribosomal-protein-alanine N-acetyltransferase